jgi:hypothetical protein
LTRSQYREPRKVTGLVEDFAQRHGNELQVWEEPIALLERQPREQPIMGLIVGTRQHVHPNADLRRAESIKRVSAAGARKYDKSLHATGAFLRGYVRQGPDFLTLPVL